MSIYLFVSLKKRRYFNQLEPFRKKDYKPYFRKSLWQILMWSISCGLNLFIQSLVSNSFFDVLHLKFEICLNAYANNEKLKLQYGKVISKSMSGGWTFGAYICQVSREKLTAIKDIEIRCYLQLKNLLSRKKIFQKFDKSWIYHWFSCDILKRWCWQIEWISL